MGVRSVYFDTNIIIAAFEGINAFGQAASALLDAASAGEFEPVTSDLTLAEILVKPLQNNDKLLIAAYEGLFTNASPFRIVSITRNRLRAASRLRANFPALKLADAIHVACCNFAFCDVLVTADRRFPNELPMPVLMLCETTLDEIRAI